MISPEAGPILLCAVLSAGFGWLVCSPPPAAARLRRLDRPLAAAAPGGPAWPPRAAYAVVGVAVITAAAFRSGYPAVLLLGAVGAVGIHRWRCRRARQRAAADRRTQVRQFCVALAAELRSGRSPREAAARAAMPMPGTGPLPALASIAQATTSGGDPGDALARAAEAPGAEALRLVAACWRAGEQRGAGLAEAVERLVDGLEHEQAHRLEVAAQLAGARATARLLGVLPVLGLALGMGLGANPVPILLGTPYGLGCLLLGCLLDGAGLVWTERLARTAEGEA